MSAHTPGPWVVIPPRIGAAITIYGADREFPVATTCSNTSPATMQAHRDGTVIANANLIAAAPELLEAAEIALDGLRALLPELHRLRGINIDIEEHSDEVIALRNAIVKAGGKA